MLFSSISFAQLKENMGELLFLDFLALQEGRNYFTDVRPVNRLQLAKEFQEMKNNKLMSKTISERISYYTSEYSAEKLALKRGSDTTSQFFTYTDTSRFYLYGYFSSAFSFTVNPIFELNYDLAKSNYQQFGGLTINGTVGSDLWYWFNYRDNIEIGSTIDKRKQFGEESGVSILRNNGDLIDYSETRGGFQYEWSWGDVTAAKDFVQIGSGQRSSVILSPKAPSFPFLRIEAYPVDWFKYNFFHIWLDSDLLDSMSIRNTEVSATVLRRNKTYSRLQKFYVGHSMSFEPFENFWMTFGESIIYGDEIEYVYFLPVFLRLADHYNSIGGGDSGDNAQLFLNYSYVWPALKSKLYFSLYLDEFSPSDLFSGGENAQVFSYTAGTRFVNPFFDNNIITFEYVAVRPYVGMNADPLHSYKSSGYDLGHWIGTNALQFYVESLHYLPYMIDLRLYYTYVIKGSKEKIDDYYNRVKETYPLLSGDKSYFSEMGLSFKYSPIRDLFFETSARLTNIATGRFLNEYSLKKGLSLTAGVRYGFQ